MPDEYKKMRDETKEELRTDPNLMNEVRGHYINENKAELVSEAQKHYGVSKGIQNHIDELTPKPPKRSKSYGHSL